MNEEQKRITNAIGDAKAVESEFWETVRRLAGIHASLVGANISSRMGSKEWPQEADDIFRRLCDMANRQPVFTKRERDMIATEKAIQVLDYWGTNNKRAAGLEKYRKELEKLNGQNER